MAPKNRKHDTAATISPTAAAPSQSVPSAAGQPTRKTSTSGASSKNSNDPVQILQGIWDNYMEKTPQRTKLIDVFMAFLVVVGALQFVYCVIAGNYPFNAFLAGFSATVGQFVLTASLRMQTNLDNAGEFKSTSPERAFADFVFGSFILHFFCVNFIN
ncbi:defender against death DAD protein [Rhizodiscina lignyota]|uniref:Dolichyl-diphosphooligosaccharide--protein glycosyltransferase subunit OST2 n=1 Tax=Rhizodiscina lignyota TaxID=1504668 RepID=A0A9P4IJI0_9PEZI|nr:defender against death DAD protein [Rhizodiscina lignyota]